MELDWPSRRNVGKIYERMSMEVAYSFADRLSVLHGNKLYHAKLR